MKIAPYTTDPNVIVMLGVHPESTERGGVSSVVDVYEEAGLFTRWPIAYIATVSSGSALTKIAVAGRALYRYLKLLLGGRVSLVHAHTASRASFWRKSIFILLALAAHKPVILHLHGARFGEFYERECGALRRAFVRGLLSRVDRVIVLSSQWQKVIEGIAPAAKVVLIANPVAVPAEVCGVGERDQNVLLFLGRFGWRKGIFDLLESLVRVKERVPQVRFRCAGDGDIASVRARAQELGLEDCVDILGWIEGAEKEQELSRAAIYVLPSYAEGLPMGVLEAMAAGVPTVASTVGGIPDAIDDGVEGFLVPPGDVDALANRLTRLFESVELRKEFAAAARRKVCKQFSTETVLAQVEDLYRSLGSLPRAGQGRTGIRPRIARTQE